MNLNSIREALFDHLKEHFTGAPLSMPNLNFKAPAGPWVRVDLDMGETFGRERGPSPISFRKGVLRLLVYDQANRGLVNILEIAQELEALFRLVELPDAEGVLCGDPWTGPGEEDDEIKGYEFQEVRVPWQALVEF